MPAQGRRLPADHSLGLSEIKFGCQGEGAAGEGVPAKSSNINSGARSQP